MIRIYDPSKKSDQPRIPLTLAIAGNDQEVWVNAVSPSTGKLLCNLVYIGKDGIELSPRSRSTLESANVDTSAVAWAKDGSIKVSRG